MNELKLAVVGKDVSKSVSPQIHGFIAKEYGIKISYDKVSISENEFCDRIKTLLREYDGFNVTIPFKLSVIPYLENLCGDARTFGAVNTVRTRDLTGYNTDGAGFALMLKNNGADVKGKNALVIGAGGAGRSVAKKLADAGAAVSVYDKNLKNALNVAAEFEHVTALDNLRAEPYYAVINASGVGMHSTEGVSPADERLLKLCEVAADLIYVPAKSEFLSIAERCGKKIINGEAMLFYQAYYADCIYFGLEPDEERAKALFEKFGEECKK